MNTPLRITNKWTLTGISLLFVVICLLPIHRAGLNSDLLLLFQYRNGVSEIKNLSIAQLTNAEITHYIVWGRFTPLADLWRTIFFKYLGSIFAVKFFIFLLSVGAVLSFVFLLDSLGIYELSPLFLVFYAAGIQFRLQYFDAYTTWYGFYQFLGICIFICLAFYTKALDNGSIIHYSIAFILALFAILFSEVSYCIIPLMLAIAFYKDIQLRRVLVTLVPFAVMFIVYLAGFFLMRRSNTEIAPNVSFNLSFIAVSKALCVQSFGTLPFSNMVGYHHILSIFRNQLHSKYNLVSILLILLAVLYVFFKMRGKAKDLTYGLFKNRLFVFSSMLFLLPAAIISLSAKHQSAIHWGIAYLPVYIQNFGLALVLAQITYLTLRSTNKYSQYLYMAIASVGALGILTSFLFNSYLINYENYVVCNPAQALYRSIEKGALLSDCEQSSKIMLLHDYYYDWPEGYRDIMNDRYHKDFTVFNYDSTKVLNEGNEQNCYLLDCSPGEPIYVKLFKLDCGTMKKGDLLKCDTIDIYKSFIHPGID